MDCGLTEGSSFTVEQTGLNYTSDASFISTGVSKSIAPEYRAGYQQQMTYLRSFPDGIRNCYKISVKKGTKYLISTTFLYGDYDNKNVTPKFDLHVGGNLWDTVYFISASIAMGSEMIYTPPRGYLLLCLVNTGNGTPFINSIELRPLSNDTYAMADSTAFFMTRRLDLGSTTNSTYRSVIFYQKIK